MFIKLIHSCNLVYKILTVVMWFVYLPFVYCSGDPWTGRGVAALPPDKNSRDVEFLDKYAVERWEVKFIKSEFCGVDFI